MAELEGSLERMGFDRLDLLYSSTLPDAVPVAVAVEQIAAVLATGRVTAWSVVNWSAEAIAQAAREAQRPGDPAALRGPAALQPGAPGLGRGARHGGGARRRPGRR